MKKVLLLDASNLIYRARYSAKYSREGDAAIVYSFFRSLRPLIEKFEPDICYFVRDGVPSDRSNIFPDYKKNRKREKNQDFFDQKKLIEEIVDSYFPIISCKESTLEADDLIAHFILNEHKEDCCVIVSSDTDFIQLLQQHDNCVLYNPISKKVREPPDYDYLIWKALRGDSSDNIPGIPRVGDKTAAKLAASAHKLESFLNKQADYRLIYERNLSLIKFRFPSDKSTIFIGRQDEDFQKVREKFSRLQFKSMINEKSWKKYTETFRGMGNENRFK